MDNNFVALKSPTDPSLQSGSHDPQPVKIDDSSPNNSKLVSLTQLFAFADKIDMLLMGVGSVGAVAMGISQPIQMVLFGDMVNSFNPSESLDPHEFRAGINKVARNYALVGAAVVVSGFLQVACWSISSLRQIKRIRSAYVRSILTKELGWFDVHEPMELSSRVAESAVTIQNGMGRKIGDGINCLSMAVSAIIIALIKGWELALVMLAFTPVIAVTGFVSTKVLSAATQAGVDAYGKAGAIAQESLSNVRTVHMFNAVQHFIGKYDQALHLSTKAGIKKGYAVGWGTGLLFFTIFCTYAGGFFYGVLKVANARRDGCVGDGCYDGGRVVTVFFSTIIGAMALGKAGPSIEALFSARAAAYDVFAVINEESHIDPLSEAGLKPNQVQGKIEINRVTFAYPSRPDVQVCSSYSLTILPGETVALVGPSGSGKSTIVALIERFYDPQSGSVKLDGVDVRELNVKWLREQIGLVGQEPVLFGTSILENIRYGCPGATDEQVVEAAKMANAFGFISDFPMGFATEVGERGTQLSGGQKQRIAIARAIIKNPAILLLDEATSALDAESERVVQQSLDVLLASSSSTRTTIIVAHRLSTVRKADKIAVHSNGAIVEMGTHNELIRVPTGHYRLLAEAQESSAGGGSDARPTDKIASAGLSKSSTPSLQKDIVFNHDKVDKLEDSSVAEDDDDAEPVLASRVWRFSRPEWKYLAVGSFGATVHALVFPLWGVVLSKMFVLFFEDKTRSDLLRTARYWSLGFVGLGIVLCVSLLMQHYSFAVVSHRLISRVRLRVFTSMLCQEIGWFDLKENSSGALVSRLATDSATLQALTSDLLNQGLVSFTTIGVAFGIAFYSSWEMTLLLVATAPLFAFGSIVEAKIMNGSASTKKNNDADTAAGALLAEAIESIRTVASLNLEGSLTTKYVDFLHVSKKTDAQAGILGGAAFGGSQGMLFFNVAFLFFVGGKWVSTGRLTFEDMLRVVMVIMLSMMAFGIATRTMTDQTEVRHAAHRVFHIIDRTPLIDATSNDGKDLAVVHGSIEFQDVGFAYPSRPDAMVYKNYNLNIAAGETVALVGASGSGKSTAIALLERFYDPKAGSVQLDGVDLRELRLQWLRERISLVSQEPVLFASTIADNIALGRPGATRLEIEQAAKSANAFDFISQFPDGFDTEVGDRGAQVSGGQKQRIAIARAILRNPSVLLLDEATSALDNESERLVQASLDNLLAEKKRTTIIVAHRLSTIRHADRIVVVENGGIVEQGTHDDLLALPHGVYKSLVAHQVSQSEL